jgi:predicted transcriptional regulator
VAAVKDDVSMRGGVVMSTDGKPPESGWFKLAYAAVERAAELKAPPDKKQREVSISAAFHVYAILAYHARRKRECWPSITTLVEMSGRDRSTVYAAIEKLEAAGWIQVHRGRGYRGGNVYHLTPLATSANTATGRILQTTSANTATSLGGILRPKEEERKRTKKETSKTNLDDVAFEERFWPAVSRKVGKQDARRAFAKARALLSSERGMTPAQARDRLVDRMTAFAKTPKGQAGEFCPHPSTWLNKGRYDDDPSEWERSRDNEKPSANFGDGSDRVFT